MKNHESIKALFRKICEAENEYLGPRKYPEYGQVVCTGLIQGKPYDFDHAIGYLVQIRKGRGQFGTDQYLLRHPNGTIVCHENQSLWLIGESLSKQALIFFAITPEQEGGDTEYTLSEGRPEKGYMIEFQYDDPVSENTDFCLALTIETADK
ncbi:hypothetical protein [Algicola sagamiensis]|uniref:hypothetical protein n=1 Tax=Algicola sagamiensis TaxID=163869 RepID=UPI00037C70EA|nr:hypothetical protein [Algicola sagamiensis]